MTEDLGFAEILEAGMSPQEAWEQIRAQLQADPGAGAMFAELERTPEGRAALEHSRRVWAEHGLTPPWEALAAEPAPAGCACQRRGLEPVWTEPEVDGRCRRCGEYPNYG